MSTHCATKALASFVCRVATRTATSEDHGLRGLKGGGVGTTAGERTGIRMEIDSESHSSDIPTTTKTICLRGTIGRRTTGQRVRTGSESRKAVRQAAT